MLKIEGLNNGFHFDGSALLFGETLSKLFKPEWVGKIQMYNLKLELFSSGVMFTFLGNKLSQQNSTLRHWPF